MLSLQPSDHILHIMHFLSFKDILHLYASCKILNKDVYKYWAKYGQESIDKLFTLIRENSRKLCGYRSKISFTGEHRKYQKIVEKILRRIEQENVSEEKDIRNVPEEKHKPKHYITSLGISTDEKEEWFFTKYYLFEKWIPLKIFETFMRHKRLMHKLKYVNVSARNPQSGRVSLESFRALLNNGKCLESLYVANNKHFPYKNLARLPNLNTLDISGIDFTEAQMLEISSILPKSVKHLKITLPYDGTYLLDTRKIAHVLGERVLLETLALDCRDEYDIFSFIKNLSTTPCGKSLRKFNIELPAQTILYEDQGALHLQREAFLLHMEPEVIYTSSFSIVRYLLPKYVTSLCSKELSTLYIPCESLSAIYIQTHFLPEDLHVMARKFNLTIGPPKNDYIKITIR